MDTVRIIEINVEGKPIWITSLGTYMDNRNEFIETLCHAHGEFDLKFVDWNEDWKPMFKDLSYSREKLFEIVWKQAKKRS